MGDRRHLLAAAIALLSLVVAEFFALCHPAASASGQVLPASEGTLSVAFEPGAADAAGAMCAIEVAPDGVWYVPACGYVREGHECACWLATTGDGRACEVAIASRVEGMLCEGAGQAGVTQTLDLASFVEDGTLTLTALWRAEAAHEEGVAAPSGEDVEASPVEAGPVPCEWGGAAGVASAFGAKDGMADTYVVEGEADAQDVVLVAASETDPASGAPVAVLCSQDCAYPAGTLVITRTAGDVVDDAVQELGDTCGNELVGTCWTKVEDTSSLTVPWERCRPSIRAVVAVEGTRVAPLSMSSWFERCVSLESAELSALDLTDCADLTRLFARCTSLTRVDAGGWDLSGVTTLAYAFQGCTALATLDVAGWDVSHVTSLSHAFDGCTALAALDVSGWDTRRLRTATSAFEGCATVSEIAVGGLRMQSVTNASSMLKGCASLVEVDLSGWSTPRLKNASHLLDGCSSLSSVDLSGLDTHGCTTLSQLFRNCVSLASVDVSCIDVSAATDLSGLFEGCSSLAELDLSGWDTHLCQDLSGLLSGCDALAEADLSGIDTCAATDLSGMLPQEGALRRVTFGARACLSGAATDAERMAQMAPAPATPPHTGRWENAGTGACFTSDEMQTLAAGGLAGTWEWEVGFFPLTLDAAGGTWADEVEPPAWYAKGVVTALPGAAGGTPAPVRSGYALAGWLDEAGDVVTEIGADSAGPRSLSAVWEVCQVRMRVPVALTLSGVPTSSGVALALAEGERPLVENLGTTDTLVSAALSVPAETHLALSVALGGGQACDLAEEPVALGVAAAGEELAITEVSGETDAPAHTSANVPIGSILWTFAVARGGEGL